MAAAVPTCVIAGVEVGPAWPVRLMAVVNVSPESFYRDSVRGSFADIQDAARRFVDEGADLIDIGAMSTAPYQRTEVPEADEMERMTRAVEAVARAVEVPISADTTRPAVARAAFSAGARVLNDVGGLRIPQMGEVAAAAEGVVLMAAPGAGDGRAAYAPIDIVAGDLRAALARADRAGVHADRIVVDPGIGFYTSTEWRPAEFNCGVLRDLARLGELGYPVLIGVSRKSFVGTLTGRSRPDERLAGSLAATALAVWNGASIVRTHDVAATRDVIRVVGGVMRAP
jgi:dihydropteroate synthase